MSAHHDTYEIGFREDGVMFVTASESVATPEDAEKSLGPQWRAVEDVHVAPTGRQANSRDPEWAPCAPGAPGARPAWRLVSTATSEIFDGEDWIPNPHYESR
jgi:hypothetical protein